MVFWGAKGTDILVMRARQGNRDWSRALSAFLVVVAPVLGSFCVSTLPPLGACRVLVLVGLYPVLERGCQ